MLLKLSLKSFLITFTLTLVSLPTFAQNFPKLINSGEVIKEGIQLHDDEKYDKAIAKYKLVHELDTNYFFAQYEISLALLAQKKYEEAAELSKSLIAQKTDQEMQYNILGSALDNLKRFDESIEAYNQGLKKYPYNDNLLFNRSVVFESKKEIKKSIDSHIQHLAQNPFYASTHLRLGVLCLKEGFYTQSMMSLATFLLLEPASGRSLNVLNVFNNLASLALDDAVTEKSEGLVNEFEDIDFLVKNKVALNKKYKVPADLDFPMVKQLYLVIEKINEQKSDLGDGFWAKFYAPFFIELYKLNKFNHYSMYLLISSTNEQVQKKLKKNIEKIKLVREETVQLWKRLHDEFEVEIRGKKQKVQQWYSNKNKITAIGNENSKRENIGDYLFIRESGMMNIIASYTDGKKSGNWIYFNENGDTAKLMGYENDKPQGPYKIYFLNGRLREEGNYVNGELDGNLKTYYANGMLKTEYSFKAGKLNGKMTEYYAFGGLKGTYDYADGELNGELVQYFPNDKIKVKSTYEKGKRTGISTDYHNNGQIMSVVNYINNESDGDYKKYYKNGKIEREGKVLKGFTVGEWKYYDKNGKLTDVRIWDETGKKNGEGKAFTASNRVYNEEVFAKGEIKNMKYFSPDGKVFKEFKFNKGTGKVAYYDELLDLVSEGEYINTKNNGPWKYYFKSGVLKTLANYKDDELDGLYTRYFVNGEIDYKVNYKAGNLDGLFQEYYNNKKPYRFGNYVNDERWGEWIDYFKDGSIKTVNYYEDGEVKNTKYYTVNGNVEMVHFYDEYYDINKTVIYDTTGQRLDSIIYPGGKFEMVRKGPTGEVLLKATCYGGVYHGPATWLYPNGKTLITGEFLNDERHGKWTWYHPNGKVSSTGEYHLGEQHGKWEYFDFFGFKTSERLFEYGENVGTVTRFDEDGKKESTIEYNYGERHGKSSFFAPSGELKIVRYYFKNKFIGYAYHNAQKQLVDTIFVKNESAEIKAYYPNGKVSVEYTFKNGDIEGDLKHYYPNGQIMRDKKFKNDDEIGESKEYYENGKLRLLANYVDGKKQGIETAYYDNGQIKYTLTYLNDLLHGKAEYFDKTGKKLHTFIYYDGEIVSK